ncbi:class I SAM-dependent methyltransferase [Actinoalloteichus sp. GBA129-24]|uniref:class I SAM-dependent methyltransferase n=1 Tax=Actinoalloteichus sp. GBA129-24 TaxID=1612551 RepID=UPI00095096D2|nr:class I SAM-dependent methyltransferase [Actinoalloteichus sp. GBA129-24]APU21284.1 2-polyprenyl-3-methyl-5-hydroxy-6-metoxy-1,4-benzoquinol methylase [Actinoalloteichus sp. GBA129-24]
MTASRTQGDAGEHAAWLSGNQAMWDARVPLHTASDWYDVDGFRRGELALDDLERSGVGDVRGRSLLHLQCHIGLGTLSWTRLGADATGVDFSGEAIIQARALAKDLGLPTRFERAEVSSCRLNRTFDVCFTSWGVLMWLPDLAAWARTIAVHLHPGGEFFLAEGHPHLFIWDDVRDGAGYLPRNPYFAHQQPVIDSEASTYVDPSMSIGLPQYRWNHPLSEVVTAVAAAGLRITELTEHSRLPWQPLSWMVPDQDPGWWRIDRDPFPLSFTLKAVKEKR